jgi:hypothetical protein
VTSSLSAATALVYFLLILFATWRSTTVLFAWDATLVILWATLTGIFASIYVGAKPGKDDSITRMKQAVWVDLTNLVMWVISTAWQGGAWAGGAFRGPDNLVPRRRRVKMTA